MTEPVTMPRYFSIAYVNAIKIASQEQIESSFMSPWRLIPEEVGQAPIVVPYAFMANNMPQNGGYYVTNANGQNFYMSALEFDAAYTKG